jgi:hypothetical protein
VTHHKQFNVSVRFIIRTVLSVTLTFISAHIIGRDIITYICVHIEFRARSYLYLSRGRWQF